MEPDNDALSYPQTHTCFLKKSALNDLLAACGALLTIHRDVSGVSAPEVAVWLSRPCVFPQLRPQTFPEALSEPCLKPRQAARYLWSVSRRPFLQPSACGGKATTRYRAPRGRHVIYTTFSCSFSLFIFIWMCNLKYEMKYLVEDTFYGRLDCILNRKQYWIRLYSKAFKVCSLMETGWETKSVLILPPTE